MGDGELHIAWHEAGHAVAAVLNDFTLAYCSLDERSTAVSYRAAWDHIERLPPEQQEASMRQHVGRMATDMMAGEAGEVIGMGRAYPDGAHQDEQNVEREVGRYLERPEDLPTLLAYARQEALRLLTPQRDALARVVAALIERGRLTGQEVLALVRVDSVSPVP